MDLEKSSSKNRARFSLALPKPKDLHLAIKKIRGSLSPSSSGVLSPVTDLALNLGELHTDGEDEVDTPNRKLQLSLSGEEESPAFTQCKSKTLEKEIEDEDRHCFSPNKKSSKAQPESNCLRWNPHADVPEKLLGLSFLKSSAYQRFQSMPSPYSEDKENVGCSLLRPRSDPDAPKSFSEDDESSQESADSGCVEDMPISFSFPKPAEPAPRRNLKLPLGDSTNSPVHHKNDHAESPKFRCSSRTLSFSPSPKAFSPSTKNAASPLFLKTSSLTFSPAADDGDDGFLDMVDMDEAGNCESPISRPTGFCSLLSAPINSQHRQQKPKCPKRGLFRSPSNPGQLDRSQSFTLRSRLAKRNEPCQESCLETESPTSCRQPTKRRKSIIKSHTQAASPLTKTKLRHTVSDMSPSRKPSPTVRFQRSYSCADATDATAAIKTILDQNTEGKEELVGDYSRSYALPTIPGKHQDLKSITAETLADVMNNKYCDVISEASIIDCRYPYEYNGGHIQGGRNLYTKDAVLDAFMAAGKPEQYQVGEDGRRKVLIFHCEFSSERAPKMARFLRNMDRDANQYPALHYPEVYILHNGYKEFYAKQKSECQPQSYRPMLHSDYVADLKHFKVKSKSWSGEVPRSRSSRSLFC